MAQRGRQWRPVLGAQKGSMPQRIVGTTPCRATWPPPPSHFSGAPVTDATPGLSPELERLMKRFAVAATKFWREDTPIAGFEAAELALRSAILADRSRALREALEDVRKLLAERLSLTEDIRERHAIAVSEDMVRDLLSLPASPPKEEPR